MMGSSGGALVAVGLLAAERRIVKALREVRATVPERAVASDTLPSRGHRRLARLQSVGAIVRTAQGHLYLDEPVYAEYQAHRRRMILIAVSAALLAAIAVLLLFGA